jgi:hypothetical protein
MNQAKTESESLGTRFARVKAEDRLRAMRRGQLVALSVAFLLLQACTPPNYSAQQEAQTPVAPLVPDDIVTGSQLRLRVPLNLPASGAPLLFQSNAIVTQGELGNDVPYCRFTPASSGAPRTLKPAVFTVRSIDYDDRETTAAGKPLSVTHYQLASDPKQPGYVLSCLWPEGAPAFAFVTTDQVQATISAFFALIPVQ